MCPGGPFQEVCASWIHFFQAGMTRLGTSSEFGGPCDVLAFFLIDTREQGEVFGRTTQICVERLSGSGIGDPSHVHTDFLMNPSWGLDNFSGHGGSFMSKGGLLICT